MITGFRMIKPGQIPFERFVKIPETRIVNKIDKLYPVNASDLLDRQLIQNLVYVFFGISRQWKGRLIFDLYLGNSCGFLSRSLYRHI